MVNVVNIVNGKQMWVFQVLRNAPAAGRGGLQKGGAQVQAAPGCQAEGYSPASQGLSAQLFIVRTVTGPCKLSSPSGIFALAPFRLFPASKPLGQLRATLPGDEE